MKNLNKLVLKPMILALILIAATPILSNAQCNPDALSAQIEQLNQDIADKNAQITDLLSELKVLDKKIASLTAQIASKKTKLAKLSKILNSIRLEIRSLTADLRDLQILEDTYCVDPNVTLP